METKFGGSLWMKSTRCSNSREAFISFLQLSSSQGLGGHWESIRPGLLKNIFGTRVYLVKGSPICVLTATITHSELAYISGMFGKKRQPFLVAAGPILSHTKICSVRRPSSNVHFLGNYLPDGSILPGGLQFLDTLVLGDFKRAVQQGTLGSFPKTIIFFRQVKSAMDIILIVFHYFFD